MTPLHLACTYGQLEATKILVQYNADLMSFGEKKQTSLHKACAVGSVELVEVITEAAKKRLGKKGLDDVRIMK